jgi:predicted glutamine amidotransferase
MSAGSEPARATFWLLDAPDSLSVQSHREPDGTGLGWFDERGAPHVSKQAHAAYGDRRFAREAREVSSTAVIAHIRFASTGALELRNTHPFEQDGRLFAHNGVIEDLPALEAHLGDELRLVKGDTDSERFFALITREIAANAGDVQAGVTAACNWVAENLPLFAINFVLAAGDGLWRTLWQAGQEHGLVAGGYRAIDSLRLEKGYRVWAADITPDENPYEAGLGFCVRKDGGFIGAAAIGVGSVEKGDAPVVPERRLRCLVLEDPRSVVLGNEPVRIDGDVVGRVTSGGYGYTVERSIAYAYMPAEIELDAAVEVDIFGRWVPGTVTREPLYDPRGERVRG